MCRGNVRGNMGPIDPCTTNMATMSDERVALPFEVDVARGLNIHNNSRSAPTCKIFVGWGTRKFHLIANL
eukprot:12935045-Prorocentrum_lima.AAC.1